MTSSSPDETLTPSYEKSIEFLQQWCKGGPWVLVAIDPNKKGLEAETFGQSSLKELEAWLDEWGTRKKYNVYFTVNPCIRRMTTKPSREHIAALSWLHVDVDPREYPRGPEFQAFPADEQARQLAAHLDGERARIIALLSDPTAKGLPKPTALVFSGGGYQAFWRLREPRLLDGTEPDYEDAKLYNKQLELVLGGDNCHNVDRIMRLPGTINRPDPKKRKKGRVEVLAELREFNDTQHDLDKFTKAPIVAASESGFAGNLVKISGNLARISSVDDLPKGVSDQAKVMIVQGLDPDDPRAGKFDEQGRSGPLFHVCCELVRAGCDDDTIYSVITDPDFGISASVLDKGSNIERYAIRQIERAREDAIDPLLREFNDKHALISAVGAKGLCRILGEEWDPVWKQTRIVYQTQTDFMLRYKKRTVDWVTDDGKAASKPAALWWLEHTLGRQFDTVVFAPGQPRVLNGAYNRWHGWAVAADPTGSCDLYLHHVRENICGGVEAHYEYVLNWMANAVQNPGEPGGTCIVLKGEPGTGKGVFARGFGGLFGRYFLHLTRQQQLVGKFNAHHAECVLAFADEAVGNNDPEVAAAMKAIITEPTLICEAKGVDAEQVPNNIHLIMASNSTWVVPVEIGDRRYVVLDVSSEHREDKPYFNAIEAELRSGGYEALLHLLLSRDIKGWRPMDNRPVTAALEGQKRESLTGIAAVWHDLLSAGELPSFARQADDGTGRLFLPSKLFAEYVTTSERWRSKKPCSVHAVGSFLGNMGFEKIRPGTEPRSKGYALFPLPEARAAWDRVMWAEPTWDPDDEAWLIDARNFDGPAHATFGP
jgi:hypothetical protein